ncbi:YdcF family protein [Rhodospirillaceae bacterium]|jgi:uncharacterized SAM-binding protein YcdF (DUF218 family)|nr:YdcF family protein [Rhodospirillaceae bacterium]|tara:strand:+ start:4146 stop:4775 length:630 start_codon:yes stop_codon:yes gene_type:complete
MNGFAGSFSIFWRISVSFVALLFLLWLICFLHFFSSVPLVNKERNSKADAIIVLTGGVKRLAAGFELLDRGSSQLLFVSGVNASVTLPDMQKLSENQAIGLDHKYIKCCVKLGYSAVDTQGNAVESIKWIEENNIKSIFLVTSNYHMKRSHLEFQLKAPALKILEYPIVVNNVILTKWWWHPGSMRVILTEYHKFMLTWTRAFFIKLIS